jgi:hypothetical protein
MSNNVKLDNKGKEKEREKERENEESDMKGKESDKKEMESDKRESDKKLSAKEREVLRRRLHERIENGKNMVNIRNKMSKMQKGGNPKMPDFSTISKMNESELKTMARLAGISAEKLRELSQFGLKDMAQFEKILKNPDALRREEKNSEEREERISNRILLVEQYLKEGKFVEGSEKERNMIYSFMDKLRVDKELREDQKDKLRACVLVYYKLHGLGEKTPKLDEWISYGIHPDEILVKSQYKVMLDENDDDLSDLSE